MRKILVSAIVILEFFSLPLISQDQEIKNPDPFRVDWGVTFNFPTDNTASNGFGFYVEPRCFINENMTLGLKFENDFLGSPNQNTNNNNSQISDIRMYPILATVKYYFPTENIKPFIGLGIGAYEMYTDYTYTNYYGYRENSTNINSSFGIQPEIGVQIYHFNIAAVYNYAGNGITNYVGVQVGFEFGLRRFHRFYYF
jgi:hypothetical protein